MKTGFEHYHNICAATAASDELFANFRQTQVFFDMYEHVTHEQGLIYMEEIKKFPEIYKLLSIYAINDLIGNPITELYEGIYITPTTLRYIKVLCDLVKLFGCLNDMNIIEVGGGYGGQCKIIHDTFRVKSYTLVDLPESIRLAQRYLGAFGIVIDGNSGPYDLFISNYAFTEIARTYQDLYYDRFIKSSTNGYITCNFYEWVDNEGMMSLSELLRMKENYSILDELPLTAKDNFIYTWK